MKQIDIKLFLKTFFLTLFTLSLTLLFSYYFSNKYKNNSQEVTKAENKVSIPKQKTVNNLIIIKEDDTSLPEFYVLTSINPEQNTIYMLSLPKENVVYLNGLTNTLNQSYAYAGASQVIKNLEESYSIKMDNYIDSTYEQFSEFLDKFGKLKYNIFQKIDVKDEFDRVLFKLDPGENILTGNLIINFIKYVDINYNEKTYLLSDMLKEFIVQNNSNKLEQKLLNKKITDSLSKINSNISSTDIDDITKAILSLNEELKIKNVNVSGKMYNDKFYLDTITIDEMINFKK